MPVAVNGDPQGAMKRVPQRRLVTVLECNVGNGQHLVPVYMGESVAQVAQDYLDSAAFSEYRWSKTLIHFRRKLVEEIEKKLSVFHREEYILKRGLESGELLERMRKDGAC